MGDWFKQCDHPNVATNQHRKVADHCADFVAMGQRPCSQCSEECVGVGSVVALSEVNKEVPSNVGLEIADSKGRPLEESDCPEVLKFMVSLAKQNGETSFGLAHVPMEDGTSTLLIVDYKDGGPVGRWNAERVAEGRPDQAMRA